jgi:hypothetical protein
MKAIEFSSISSKWSRWLAESLKSFLCFLIRTYPWNEFLFLNSYVNIVCNLAFSNWEDAISPLGLSIAVLNIVTPGSGIFCLLRLNRKSFFWGCFLFFEISSGWSSWSRKILSNNIFHFKLSYIVYFIFGAWSLHATIFSVINKLAFICGWLWHILNFIVRKFILARSW